MRILAIETSCDDTGVAILEAKKPQTFSVLSNIVASQINVHQQYGGVFPMMAKREHQRNLVPVLLKALAESNLLLFEDTNISEENQKELEVILQREPELLKQLVPFFKKYKKPDVDLIAVTNGPGLEPCLWVGVNFARALSLMWDLPVVPVNHIESHILVNFLENKKIQFPAVSLVVSGGHTQLILVNKIGEYKILGETRDDAAGECFDKCAKLLGLGYPGGLIISQLAEKSLGRSSTGESKDSPPKADQSLVETFNLPRPMIFTKDYDFSFSGLKTAVLYADKKIKVKDQEYKENMAFEVQQAIIDVLSKKTLKAIKDFDAKSLILGGGVSANKELRKSFKISLENSGVKLYVPESHLSTDNALMIAVSAFYHQKETKPWQKIEADGNLRVG